jgi:hypothetical protein
MEKKKTIQELISALQTLRLEEAELTAQLEEALNNEGEQGYTTNKQTAVVTNREERRNTNRNLAGGDRIRIKNRLHKPANWNNDIEWVESEGKNATVTEVLTKGTSIQGTLHYRQRCTNLSCLKQCPTADCIDSPT